MEDNLRFLESDLDDVKVPSEGEEAKLLAGPAELKDHQVKTNSKKLIMADGPSKSVRGESGLGDLQVKDAFLGKQSMAGVTPSRGRRSRKDRSLVSGQVKSARVTGPLMADNSASNLGPSEEVPAKALPQPILKGLGLQVKSLTSSKSVHMAGGQNPQSKGKAMPREISSQVKTATVTSGQVMAGSSTGKANEHSPVEFMEDVRRLSDAYGLESDDILGGSASTSSGLKPGWSVIRRGKARPATTAGDNLLAGEEKKKRPRKQISKKDRAAKRKLKEGSEQSAFMRIPKRPKVGNYKEALINNFRIIIYNDAEEVLSEDRGKFIQKSISDELKKHMIQNGTPIRFEKIYWSPNHVVVCCSDEQTKSWVENLVSQNPNWWPEANLATTTNFDAPKRIPVVVYLENSGETDKDIQSLLGWQNPSLAIKTWRVWNSKQFENGTRIAFGVDAKELDTLEKLDGVLHYDVGRVRFTLPDQKQPKATSNPANQGTEEPEIVTGKTHSDDYEMARSDTSAIEHLDSPAGNQDSVLALQFGEVDLNVTDPTNPARSN